MVDFVDLGFTHQISNDILSAIDGILVRGVDGHISFIINVNLNACFSDNLVDGFATLTDDNLDFVHINLDGINLRCSWCQFWTRCWDSCFNQIQDFKAGLLSLSQGLFQDFWGNPCNLDIHLQGGNSLAGTRYLEVHIAEVIFQTLDVCQNSVVGPI